MRIFLAGVSCVGKTTVGTHLAALRGVPFFDLDREVERFFQRPIGRLQAECLTMHSYRHKAAKVLKSLLTREQSRDAVIALPPSGLMGSYWKTVEPARGVVVVLTDTPENIVQRLAFYDEDSRPVERILSGSEKRLYAREVRKDMAYFGRSYKKADLTVDISRLGPREAAAKVNEVLAHRS
jgi:shikimate kinase